MMMNAAKYATRMVARTAKLMAMMGLLAVMAGAVVSSRIPTQLESVLDSGELHVISRNGPTTFYEGPNGNTGFEYVIAEQFAKHLGVKLVIHDEEDLGVMIDHVANKAVHFAAAGLTVTDKRQQKVKFGESYLDITQQLIYRSGQKRPKNIDDIIGKKILIIGNSAHAEKLRELKREHPSLSWEERNDIEMLDLLEMVHAGEIDITVVDSNAYEMNTSLYPKARVAFDISESQQLAWAFPIENDASLYTEAQLFFESIKSGGLIEDTLETYYGHLGELDYSSALLFAHRVDSRLPKWEEELKKAALEHDLDWHLLAAISYQESHWNPKAKSPTGVRGFMMLTRNTAKEMNVTNRLDAKQSIAGGAKYFKKIYNRIPSRIAESDRTWLALAAYNVGLGHVEDARILTEHHGGNPDKWSDVRENILLLAKRKYYKFTKHGYARGWEAVSYVQNIRNFYTIIAWNEKEEIEQLALNEAPEEEFAHFGHVMTEAVKTIASSSL